MFQRTRSAAVPACLLIAMVTAASGCVVTSRQSVEESGVLVSNATLQQVEVGETSEAWLLATLGDPSRITEVNDESGTRVYTYDHVVHRRDSGSVLVLFAGSTNKRKVSRTFFEIQNGVVTRYWSEPARHDWSS